MAESFQKSDYVFDGNYANFPRTLKLLEHFFHTKQIKNKTIDPQGKISIRGIYYFMLMSTCPDKHNIHWAMRDICDQNDIDRAGIQTDEERTRYRAILEQLEIFVFDNQSEDTISQFLCEVLDSIRQFFAPDLVEIQEIDYADIYAVIRFLQKIYTNWLQYSRQNSSKASLSIIDYARNWDGRSAEEFSQHLRTIQRKRSELTSEVKLAINDHMIHDLIISSLKSHPDLSGIHTLLRAKFSDKPQDVTISYIESQVNMILTDVKPETSKASQDEPIASLTTAYFAQKKNRSIRGNFISTQSRSPIKKHKEEQPLQRLPASVWEKMSKEARDQFIQEQRKRLGESHVRRGNRGRGGRSNQFQRPSYKAADPDHEADMSEVNKSRVECFNTEITETISDMSELANEDEETNASREQMKPKILFTAAEETQETNEDTADHIPKVESSSTDSPQSSGWSIWWPVLLLVSIFGAAASHASEAFNGIVKKFLQVIRSAGLVVFSFISNFMQAEKSATSCATAQYKPYFRFFGGTYIQYGVWTAIFILIIAILLQCGAQATSIGRSHVNASKTLLTGHRISPQMSHGAAQSLLEYKNGNWLFSYEREDLEVHTVTHPTADRDFCLDWCLDSGASCHFCNDSTKFMSMRKCNISISTAKKGESLQAIGMGNCQITILTASGELSRLVLHDVLYVPDARRNLLSVSKLAQDRFQTVLPANDSIFCPGIYNCRKNKSSAEHSIPIVQVGNLFHVHTCADAEIKRHDRAENKWILWHRRLGYMPFDTIQQMVNSCQGLEDLQGISMPRNYISASVRQGKATNMDQPKSIQARADRPLQVVHFDLFGPCKHSSFAGHNYCIVLVDDHTRYTWVYTVKNKSDVFDVLKKFYADTAIIRSKHPLCCFRRDNAGENFSAAVQKWMTENGIKSSSSTPHEPWQNARAEVQIRVLCNIARTNMIASGLTGKFWARAIFYAADILNIQYRTDLKMSPHQKLFGSQPDVSKCQPFGVECWLYVRAEQRQDRKFDARGEPAIYCGRSTMDNRSSYVLYVPGRLRPTFVSTNNVVFGNKCPMAKDAPNVIADDEVAFDFPPEAHASEISSSSVEAIYDQTDTHYILRMTDNTVKSMNKAVFESSFVHAQNDKWTQKKADILNQILFLQEVNVLNSNSFFDADSVHFTDTTKYVDPTSYADAMSRPDAKLWREAFDKEMSGLVQRKVFTVVERPVDRNPLGTTMVYKYKIDRVKNTVTRKCRLCLRGDWQKEGIDFFKYKTFSAVLNCRENRTLYSLVAANKWHMFSSDITQAFTYGKLDVPLFCHPPPGFECPQGTVLGLNYCLYGAKQAPAGFKSVITDFHLGEGFKAVNDAQTVWVKRHNQSILINAIFVDDVLHCTNDMAMYRTFRKRFEKRFELKSDDHIDVYLGNRIVHDRVKGSVTVSQEHYAMACLERFGLANCNGVDKPITSRLTAKDQPADVNTSDQELYRGMVGSLLYLASWTRPDIAFSVSDLSRFVSNPGKPHLEAAKRVFRYIKKTISFGLTYRTPVSHPSMPEIPANTLWGYVDSDWAGCPDSRRSTSGFVFMLNGAAISWRSKRQATVALSSAEAEFISASAMVQEVIYLRKFLSNLGFPQSAPTPVFADNETCIAWSEGSVGGSERAKHVDLRVHFVHEARAAGHLLLHKVDSKLNAADILTKASTPSDVYEDLRRRIMGY